MVQLKVQLSLLRAPMFGYFNSNTVQLKEFV